MYLCKPAACAALPFAQRVAAARSCLPANSHCNCELLGSLCVDACVSEGTAAPRPWTSLMCRGLESEVGGTAWTHDKEAKTAIMN
mmetsp:Transcript_88177/g.180162  ORF Transcript_88177/g.180162 Transcript_88177/m.180162 type:complete len:85 (+) Transcript_88177:902-1156(+)